MKSNALTALSFASAAFIVSSLIGVNALAYDSNPSFACTYGFDRSAGEGHPDLHVAIPLKMPKNDRDVKKTKVDIDVAGDNGSEKVLVVLTNVQGRDLDFSIFRHALIGWQKDPTLSGSLDTSLITAQNPIISNSSRDLLGVITCGFGTASDSQN